MGAYVVAIGLWCRAGRCLQKPSLTRTSTVCSIGMLLRCDELLTADSPVSRQALCVTPLHHDWLCCCRFIDAASRYYELSSISIRQLGDKAISEEDLMSEHLK